MAPSGLFSLSLTLSLSLCSPPQVVENVVCILRNLSYRLEFEVDTQAGSDDCLDPDWEREQHSELDEEGPTHSPGYLAFCARPRTSDRSRATSLASKPV